MENKELKPLACLVIESIMNKGIEWYDYNKLTPSEKKAYYSESRMLLKSKVLINEANAFITDLVKEIAYNSEDYKKVENLRYSINGVKALLERIESIEDPEVKISTDDLNSAI